MTQFYINMDIETDLRYDFAKFLRYNTDNYNPITSKFLTELRKLKTVGEFIVTVQEGRADLVSYEIYGSTQYWWIILEYNDLMNVDDLTISKKLNFPKLSDLEDLYFSLKSMENGN